MDHSVDVGDEGDVVLRMRLETIRTNLEQVDRAKDFVAGRRSDIHRLTMLFERDDDFRASIRDVIRTRLDTALSNAKTIQPQGEMQRGNLKQVVESVKEALAQIDRIEKQAASTAKIARAMRTRWSSFAADPFDRHVDQSFHDEAVVLISTIDGIDQTVPGKAWETYRKLIRDQSDALFSEYVEFLGGLALRDTGLGGLLPSPLQEGEDEGEDEAEDETEDEAEYNRDVCVMADELIRQIYYIGSNDLWHSMAVPGRAGATVRSVSRMIRLGFPDWTVWAVPLAAYQFGLVVVDENDLVAKYPGPPGVSAGELRVALADAFATFTAGPAYALASMFTKLEPVPASIANLPDSLSDSERVRMILSTLAFMDEDAIFEEFIGALRNQWEASIQHNGVGSEPRPATGERVTAWSDYMNQFLGSKGGKIRFDARRWHAAMEWPSLTDRETLDLALSKVSPEQQTVRDVLNAAWYQRFTSQGSSRDLAIAALGFWRRSSGRGLTPRGPTNREEKRDERTR
ncbi:hypothetical protein [Pseudarthrobacter sp. PvP090]|uniref:hypothetical protein n=1 Tax=Pseudarthrobacter sp. PvP090 TaxID=3156393 RepID=UPI0033963018